MIHDKLPIHKTGSQLLGVAARIQVEMKRGYKRAVGDKIVSHCSDMLDLMALANATKGAQRNAHIEAVLAHQRATEVWLRVALDLNVVAPALWGKAIQLTQSVGRQAGGWKGTKYEKAPAA